VLRQLIYRFGTNIPDEIEFVSREIEARNSRARVS
jgi:hypothetical protein